MLLAASKALDVCHNIGRKDRSNFLGENNDVAPQKDSTKSTTCVPPLFGWQAAIISNNLYPVSWLHVCIMGENQPGHIIHISSFSLPYTYPLNHHPV